MASVRFQSVANNHKGFLAGANTVWTVARIYQVVNPPFNWITQDEAEAIVATGGNITAAWYNDQHTQDPVIPGTNMTPTPEGFGQSLASEAPQA